jgi:hypothetical protein
MDSSAEPPSSKSFPERRSEERLISCIPVSFEVLDATDVALIRDISRGGAFLLTRTSFEIGESGAERAKLTSPLPGACRRRTEGARY